MKFSLLSIILLISITAHAQQGGSDIVNQVAARESPNGKQILLTVHSKPGKTLPFCQGKIAFQDHGYEVAGRNIKSGNYTTQIAAGNRNIFII